jgi:hypothetical protein
MIFPYTVHRLNHTSMQREVEVSGQKVMATIPSVEMELVSADGHGTLVIRTFGEEAAHMAEVYAEGFVVEVSLAPAEGQVKPPADEAPAGDAPADEPAAN